jgi:hypothetical protein
LNNIGNIAVGSLENRRESIAIVHVLWPIRTCVVLFGAYLLRCTVQASLTTAKKKHRKGGRGTRLVTRRS